MKNSKGGTFATEDMDVIRRALSVYVKYMLEEEVVGQEVENPDFKKVSNLLHRLGRIKK